VLCFEKKGTKKEFIVSISSKSSSNEETGQEIKNGRKERREKEGESHGGDLIERIGLVYHGIDLFGGKDCQTKRKNG